MENMVWFMTVIVVVVFTILEGVRGQQNNAQVQQVDNAEQFALLCRIYNVAKNPPIHHVDLQDPSKIVSEINAINASFTEDKRLNETEKAENGTDVELKHTTTREASVAQAILSRITQKAQNILDEIRKVNTTMDIEKTKTEFAQVIYGEGRNESHVCDGELNAVSNRASACGTSELSSRGDSAGKNLVIDFFCLCAMTTDDNGVENVCGVYVGGKGGKTHKPDSHGWDSKGPLGSSSMWASVKKGCGKLTHQHPMSTEEGQDVIENFLIHLKAGGLYRWGETNRIKGRDRKPGMLGTGVGTEGDHGKSLVCDGSRGKSGQQLQRSGGKTVNPAGICVYYGTESEWENIPWMMKLKSALANVEHVNNKKATIQRDIDKLEKLLHRAEEIYETTKVITEIQKPVVPPNLQTAAKRLTAYNAAQRHHPNTHFFSLFLLL
ncbi:Variant surface glycoprotein [Trypanosoma congolense IL3000]|uniref:Variant surface glycoprotein n=1 Tax=Trypanosoma congolense (strain IL3000) TaxID=1068625 RepID=F9WG42_TRYCI|nr:Variant surface glycoprotein [Trypanosoma congolense IL3000]